MLPDRVWNPGPLTYKSGALLTALCGPAIRAGAFIRVNRVMLCHRLLRNLHASARDQAGDPLI